jgi:hypothetical protein
MVGKVIADERAIATNWHARSRRRETEGGEPEGSVEIMGVV